MAKSPSEAIRELEKQVAVMQMQIARLEADLQTFDFPGVKTQLAVLTAVVADVKARQETESTRRWQVFAAGVASVFALVVNLILLAVRK